MSVCEQERVCVCVCEQERVCVCVCEQEQELVCVCACVQQRKRESITIFSAIYSSLLWLVESFQPYSKKNVVYYNFYNTLENPKLTETL